MGVVHAQTKKNRVVSKHGRINTYNKKEEDAGDRHKWVFIQGFHVYDHKYRLIKDFFTSTIALGWIWTLLSFAAAFFISWLMFALTWYLVIYSHGDLEDSWEDDHVLCVENVQSFTACFLYSVETQHTIG